MHDEIHDGQWLVIPFWAGDKGQPGLERPIGPPYVAWLSPSIEVNGTPGLSTFTPGVALDVRVRVDNWGTGTKAAAVTVTVWWADPTTAFTTKTLLGQTAVPVPTRGGSQQSPPINGTIPASAPPHVCLLAMASCLGDAPPTLTPDPINDRHWAQRNLQTVPAKMMSAPTPLWVTNPADDDREFEVRLERVQTERLHRLAELLQLRAAEQISPGGLALTDPETGNTIARLDGDGTQTPVDLKGGERMPLILSETEIEGLEPGTFFAVEVLQTADHETLIGSYGYLILGEH